MKLKNSTGGTGSDITLFNAVVNAGNITGATATVKGSTYTLDTTMSNGITYAQFLRLLLNSEYTIGRIGLESSVADIVRSYVQFSKYDLQGKSYSDVVRVMPNTMSPLLKHGDYLVYFDVNVTITGETEMVIGGDFPDGKSLFIWLYPTKIKEYTFMQDFNKEYQLDDSMIETTLIKQTKRNLLINL
jgi:hypothetical protein